MIPLRKHREYCISFIVQNIVDYYISFQEVTSKHDGIKTFCYFIHRMAQLTVFILEFSPNSTLDCPIGNFLFTHGSGKSENLASEINNV